MSTTWVVVADAARGRLFEVQDHGQLAEIKDFVNPAEREDNANLQSDAYGRFSGKGERHQGNTAEPEVHPKEHEAEQFAIHIAEFLEEARSRNRYRKLTLVASPRFLGLLRSKISEEVNRMVDFELNQDLIKANPRELQERLQQNRP